VSKELGLPVVEADRTAVEQQPEELFFEPVLKSGATVALLIVGDPFSATTHSDLTARADELGVPLTVYHNASIMNAAGVTGLQLYRFGQTVSIPFFKENWRPHSFATKIRANVEADLHTMCLLDIKVKEQTDENLLRNRPIFEPPRFMSISQAARQLLESHRVLGEEVVGYSPNTTVVAVARVGSRDQLLASMSLSAAAGFDAGLPLHTLLLCSSLHVMEEGAVKRVRLSEEAERECVRRGEALGDLGESGGESEDESE
jgi:diphthine synthase